MLCVVLIDAIKFDFNYSNRYNGQNRQKGYLCILYLPQR